MGPVQVGVRVHHLGLDPQAELHAAVPHVVHQPVQPAGPHRLVDLPVAQPRPVAAPGGEPAVVQDVPFRADAGGGVREGRQRVELVPEIHRFPHVEGDRARGTRMGGLGAQVPVELRGQAVQPVLARGEVDPGRGVGLAAGQADLPGKQQLPAADRRQARQHPPRGRGRAPVHHAQSGGHPFDPVHRVTAPRHVHPEHLAVAEPEAGYARDHDRGRVVPGVAAAALAQPQPVAELVPLRDALRGLPPGEVQDLAGPAGQREDHLQAVHHIRLAAGIGHRVPDPDRPAGDRVGLGHQAQAGDGVLGLDQRPPLTGLPPDRLEPGRPVTTGGGMAARVQPVPGQSRPAEPALTVLGQQRAGAGRPQQGRGVARLQPAAGHRAGPHRGQRPRLREQDQPGPGRDVRIRDQPRSRVPGRSGPACRIPAPGHPAPPHAIPGHPIPGEGLSIITGGHSGSDLRPGRTVR